MGDFSKDINSTFSNEWIKVLLNIKYTSNYINSISEQQFKPYGISGQQYNVLRILRGAKKAISVNTIRNRMVEKSPNLTRLMDKLCIKGYVKRTRSDEDRRTVYAEITELGLTFLNDIQLKDARLKLDVLISEEEAKTLNSLLDKLRQ
ncbi:MAG: MarR family winged helix-turn-helix transcriptional regulator [Crocinitomicaceae bacterium]